MVKTGDILKVKGKNVTVKGIYESLDKRFIIECETKSKKKVTLIEGDDEYED